MDRSWWPKQILHVKFLKLNTYAQSPKTSKFNFRSRPGNKDVFLIFRLYSDWTWKHCFSRPGARIFSDMSWLPEERFPYSWWQSILIKILRCGSLPSHVAFIMDGNRRFAKQNQLETVEGHIQGFEKLAQTLQWCHDLGINQVTVYAFRYAIMGSMINDPGSFYRRHFSLIFAKLKAI